MSKFKMLKFKELNIKMLKFKMLKFKWSNIKMLKFKLDISKYRHH
jgi:hypothetical protein